MNKLKVFTWIIVLFCLAVSVQGAITDNMLAYYGFNETAGTTLIDLHSNTYNGTITNGGGAMLGGNGIAGDGYLFEDGGGDYVTLPTWAGYGITPNNNFSLSVCVNYTITGTTTQMVLRMFGGYYAGIIHDDVDAQRTSFELYDGNWDTAYNNSVVPTNTWMCYVAVRNDTQMKMYVNGVLGDVQDIIGSVSAVASANTISNSNDATDLHLGTIDEVGLWDRALNYAEVIALYSNYTSGTSYPFGGGGAPPVPGDTINLSTPNPPDNTQYTVTSMHYNLTANASLNFTCRLNLNGSLNQTKDYENGTNVFVDFNTSVYTGTWVYNISCNTSTHNESTSNSTFYIDTVDPVITSISSPEGLVFFHNNLTGQFNLTDNFYLHALNVSIDGSQITSVMDINATQYTYNLTYNISGLAPGNHTLTLRLADGHTAEELGGDYEIDTGFWDRYLKYDFYDGGEVEIRGLPDSIFDEFTTTKLNDRYTFTYEPSDIQSNYTFEVKSDQIIHIVNRPESDYKSWVIMGDHWLDFYMPEEPNMNIEIERINDYEVRVHIKGLEHPELQQYSSIGDLNIVYQNYTFATANATFTYSSAINELEYQTISLDINTSASLINGTNASLYWNETLQTVIKTIHTGYDSYTSTFLTPQINDTSLNVTIRWEYNITSLNGSETGNITANQTIYRIGIDNCSTYNTLAVNITIRNETNDAKLISTMEGYFQVWIGSISQYRDFNLTWVKNSTYGICIDPNSSTYQTYAQFQYRSPGFATKNYYFTNTTLDNQTDHMNFYLTNETTQVTLTVTDQNDNPVQNAFIFVLSYDLGSSSFITTEIVNTDFNGDAFAQMILNTQWYRFIIVYDFETMLETTPTKILTTTKTFRINFVEDYFQNYDIVNGVSCAITYNNATNNFRMVFNDPTGNVVNATLTAKKIESYSEIIVNQTSVSSASGTLLTNIGTPTNHTYMGIGSIRIGSDTYPCGTPISINFAEEWLQWGSEGIFLSMLIMLTLILVGIWHPIVAAVLMVVGIIIVSFIGSFYMSLPILIGLIIVGFITIYRLNK